MTVMRDVEDLVSAFSSAETEEECLEFVMGRVAQENDNLAMVDETQGELSKIIVRRLQGLQLLANLLEQKIKIRNMVTIDPDAAAQRILKFFMEAVYSSLEKVELTTAQTAMFNLEIREHIAKFEKVKKDIIAETTVMAKR